jgi:hypothetical protein
MRKYAAVTALAIAVSMTMLTPAVSYVAGGSLVPLSCGSPDTARLWAPRRGISVPLALEEYCLCQCRKEALHNYYTVGPAGAPLALDKKHQACIPKCVNAFEAARRR